MNCPIGNTLGTGRRRAGNEAAPGWRRVGDEPARTGSDRRSAGFTLVELMVVVTVIGLASGIAMWSLPDPRGRVVEEATRFAARTRAAHDLAIIEARPVSVWVTGGGYGFDQRVAGRWVPLGDKPLRVERWTDGTAARLAAPQVRVTFDPTGLADRPADIRLDRGGREAGVTIGADGSVRIDG